MRRGSKRNYTTVTFMAIVIIFGHWLDFYQMVFASMSPEHVELNLFDFGVAAGFVGLIMYSTGRAYDKSTLCLRKTIRLLKKVLYIIPKQISYQV